MSFTVDNFFKIQTDPPTVCGPMKKQGKRFGMWVTRYYRLEWDGLSMNPSVVVYKDENYLDKHDEIPLKECRVSAGEDNFGASQYWLVLDLKHVKDHNKEYRFCCDSRLNREDWLETLNWACLNCNVESKYEFERGKALGEGSFSQVWKVKNMETGKVYAAKEIVKNSLKSPEEMNLREEIRIQRVVGLHDNIVTMIEFVETWDRYYLVLEYLDRGALLDRIMDAGKFTEHDALYIMMQLLEAVKYLHDKDIVHRDLKPENFLLTDEPSGKCNKVGSTFAYRICIGDFGLASHCPEPNFLHSLCGSPGYVAPEVIKEEGYGTAVDIWSLGVILYILLSGIPPFTGQNDQETFALTLKGSIKWSNLGECSPTLRDLVNNMLKLNKSARITAEAALEHPWMLGEGVGDRQLRIKDGIRTGKEAITEAVSHGISSMVSGFSALVGGSAKTVNHKGAGQLPSTSWMGEHAPKKDGD